MSVQCETTRTKETQPLLRRPKARPCDDFWHTLRIGLPITVFLFVFLPVLFRLID